VIAKHPQIGCGRKEPNVKKKNSGIKVRAGVTAGGLGLQHNRVVRAG
jgi:hypothetical protein